MYRFTSLAALIWLTLIGQISAQGPKCKLSKDGKKADCSSLQDIYKFPDKSGILKPGQVEWLNISGKFFMNADFSQFSHLTQLFAKEMDLEKNVDYENNFKNILPQLKALEELDLTGTVFTNQSKWKWPPNLMKLTLVKMKLNNLSDLENLHHLEELDLSSNSLVTLPYLDASNPVTTIYLNDNPINLITVEQVAPLCQLSALFLEISKPGSFNTQNKYHECKLLDHWFTKFHITSGSFSCGPIPTGYKHTNYDFSAKATKARNDCLNKLPSTSVFELLLYAVCFSILFPILYFGFEAYKRYQGRKEALQPISTKHRRRRSNMTLPTDVDVETGSYSDLDHEHDENEV